MLILQFYRATLLFVKSSRDIGGPRQRPFGWAEMKTGESGREGGGGEVGFLSLGLFLLKIRIYNGKLLFSIIRS